jgi:single-strand DNA-binding protein
MSSNITVTGRLTKDPELRRTRSGKLVTNFHLAHNFRERAGNGINDVAPIFFNANVWEEDGAAEVAELGLTKGSRVTVEGVWSQANLDHQGSPTPHHRRTDRQQDPVAHRNRDQPLRRCRGRW